MDLPQLLTVRDLVRILRISRPTVLRLLHEADPPLPSHRVGKQLRVRPDDLDEWLRAHQTSGRSARRGRSRRTRSRRADLDVAGLAESLGVVGEQLDAWRGHLPLAAQGDDDRLLARVDAAESTGLSLALALAAGCSPTDQTIGRAQRICRLAVDGLAEVDRIGHQARAWLIVGTDGGLRAFISPSGERPTPEGGDRVVDLVAIERRWRSAIRDAGRKPVAAPAELANEVEAIQ